ncbi:aspartate/glutamate racemase family protein [Bacillus sp. EB01]|uniref:aspartate/glutamate racemase family protein n=1 Tax=Bacillus sp. EB01 TaxID=1347086 RepID=UPI0005C6C245|nr:amino acid racemase [Bacillus sp. EB01]
MSKKIGILGGMGPMATADLFAEIVRNTPAKTDQEHIHIIVDNYPQIPPRVPAILQGTESPLPMLVESAQRLEAAGADFIIIACNTAHFWLDQLQKTVKVPIYSMIKYTATYIQRHYSYFSGKMILLASSATIQTNLYQKDFYSLGLHLSLPREQDQEVIDLAIKNVKAGHAETNDYIQQLSTILNRYEIEEGIVACIGGCTEIPLLFPYLKTDIVKINPTQLLAIMAVEQAKGIILTNKYPIPKGISGNVS